MFTNIAVTICIVLMGLFLSKCWVHICDQSLESMYIFGGILTAILLFFSYVNIHANHIAVMTMLLAVLFTSGLGIALYTKFNAKFIFIVDVFATFIAVCMRGNYTQSNMQILFFMIALILFGTIVYANCFLEQRPESKNEIKRMYEIQQEHLKGVNKNLALENENLRNKLMIIKEQNQILQDSIDDMKLNIVDKQSQCLTSSFEDECEKMVDYYTKKILRMLNCDMAIKINSKAKTLINSETKLIIIVLDIMSGEITLSAYNNERVYVSYTSGFTEIGYMSLKDDFKLPVNYFEDKRDDLCESLRKVVRLNLFLIFKKRIDERYNKEFYKFKRVTIQQY